MRNNQRSSPQTDRYREAVGPRHTPQIMVIRLKSADLPNTVGKQVIGLGSYGQGINTKPLGLVGMGPMDD